MTKKEEKLIKNKIANILYVLTFQYSKKTERQKTKDFNEAVETLYKLFRRLTKRK